MTGLPGRPRTRSAAQSMVATAASRFFAKVNQTESCWLWTASTNGAGYGVLTMSRDGVKELAHRWSYQHHIGPIPEGLVIDHLCRNRLCVNPQHLEPVTTAENIRRGVGPSARQARQERCKRGHPFEPERNSAGRRYCKRCHALHQAIRHYRKAGRPVPQHLLDELYGEAQ